MRVTANFVVALLLVGTLGCAGAKSLQSARTLRQGALEAIGAPSVNFSRVVRAAEPVDSPFRVYVGSLDGGREIGIAPLFDVGVRYGLTDTVELQTLWGLSGVFAGAKLQLQRSEHLAIAFDPTLASLSSVFLGFDTIGGDLKFGLTAPLLFGVRFGPGHELVLSAMGSGSYAFGRAVSTSAYLGGSAGVLFHVGPLALMPEVSLAYPVSPLPTPDHANSPSQLQLSVGVLYDRSII